MHMYSQTIVLTNIVISDVTSLGNNELMTKMSDAIWSYLATMSELIVAKWLHMESGILVNCGLDKGLKYLFLLSVKKW